MNLLSIQIKAIQINTVKNYFYTHIYIKIRDQNFLYQKIRTKYAK